MQANGQGNQAEAPTKRELLVALTALVENWNGIDAIDRHHSRKFVQIMDVLGSSRLSPPECRILHRYEAWLSVARRKPHAELREQWLDALKDWLFLDEGDGLEEQVPDLPT